MPRPSKAPTYRLHKPSGQAVVTARASDGARRDVYLGPHNSPESLAEYGRVIAELASTASADRVLRPRATITIDQLLITFWRFAEGHYRRPDGTPTNELTEYHETFKPLRKLYGHTAAEEFGPLALKAVRHEMLARNWARTTINNRVRRIRHVFRWATAEELVPAAVFQSFDGGEGLRCGRTTAQQTELFTRGADVQNSVTPKGVEHYDDGGKPDPAGSGSHGSLASGRRRVNRPLPTSRRLAHTTISTRGTRLPIIRS